MATNKRTLSRIGFYCGLALFLIITLFPFFVMLMTSFKSAKEAISLHPYAAATAVDAGALRRHF